MKFWKTWLGCIAATALLATINIWSADQVQTREPISPDTANQCVWDDTDDGMWIRYAQDAAKNGAWKNKWATHDNQPFGRPNHWSSIPVAGLRLLGETRKAWTHETINVAIERAAVWWNPLLMLIGGAALSWMILQLAGHWGAAIYVGLLTNPEFTGALNGLHPDHQGLIILFGCAFALSSAANMLNPLTKWWIPQGITAGALMAISPMNAYPYLVTFGVAWLVVACSSSEPSTHGPSLRKAGWLAGSITAMGWAMEYWPHWAYQVEAVTWMHALAVVAGFHAICVALALRGAIPKSRGDVGITLLGFMPILLMVIVMGKECVSTSYPEMKRLCWNIVELQSPGKNYPAAHWLWLGTTTALLAMALHLKTRQVIWATALTITAGLLWGMADRMQALATAVTCTVGLVILLPKLDQPGKSVLKAATILASICWLVPTIMEWKQVAEGSLQPRMHALFRQMKRTSAIINTDARIHGPTGVLEPDPSRAAAMAYYLDGKVGSTVYWENIEGLLNTIKILGTDDENLAKKTLHEKFFGYLTLERPEYLQAIIHAGGENRDGQPITRFTGGRWLVKKPSWLIEIAPGIQRVDQETLQKEVAK